MLASWVTQSTSTTGTGTITLDGTPPSGFIAFDDAFIDQQLVNYVIEDGNNREAGAGLLTSGATWTLARSRILEKFDSGTYSKFPSTGISLSGSAVVSCALSGLMTPGNMGHSWSTGTLDTYGFDGRVDGASGTYNLNNARAYYTKEFLLSARKAAKIALEVLSADNQSSTVEAGFYLPAVNGGPGELICKETIDCSTTGRKEVTLTGGPYILPSGPIWTAVSISNDLSALSVDAYPGSSGLINSTIDLGGRFTTQLYELTTSLPQTVGDGGTTGWLNSGTEPAIWFMEA